MTDIGVEMLGARAEQKLKEKQRRVREFRAEASRLASMANKRLQRLEGNGLTDSPAYRSLASERGERPRFGIRGKGYNEVQQEVARINQFLNAATSTVRGANRVLKSIANSTGIKYRNLVELRAKAAKFFELASKVEQYLRAVEDMGSVFDSTRLFAQVSRYIQQAKVDLADSENDVDEMVDKIADAMKQYYEAGTIKAEGKNEVGFAWYKLED